MLFFQAAMKGNLAAKKLEWIFGSH